MNRKLDILLGEAATPLASLRFDAEGNREATTFQYEDAWRAGGKGYAIDPSLPLQAGRFFHRKARDGSAFHGALADTEPDGWGRRVILRDHAKRRRGSGPLTSIDLLLAVDDFSRVGALRFRDDDGVLQRTPRRGERTAPPFLDLAQLAHSSRAVEEGSDTAADLAFLRGRATSLGGLRPKCTVLGPDGYLAIGKFPSVGDDRRVTHGEVLALRLATQAGIDAAEARLLDSEGAPVALIRRFDRTASGARRMYVSAATLMQAEASNSDGTEHTYAELADTLRIHGAAVQEDLEELWRRIAFSILITNVDDHLHNHGFLHARDGKWRLAPAFDVNPFPDRARELKTWISEDAGPSATIEALLSLVPYFAIPKARARSVLREVEAAVATWRKVGKSLGMTHADLETFAPAFEHPERAAARKASRDRP